MISPTHKLTAVSMCKTYRQTLKCASEIEANQLAAQLKIDGWAVKITPIAKH